MPSFSPTVINNVVPAVSATATNVTYEEIKRSLGDFVYFVNEMYLYSNNQLQIRGIMKYRHYDVTGNIKIENLTPAVDPYQFTNALYYKAGEQNIVVDGQNSFNFILKANTSLNFKLFTNVLSKQEALDVLHPSNFQELETIMGKFSFFEDWNNTL